MTPGTRLGPYEVTGQLGAGGMGEVYRAHDTTLNRDVALKVLPEGLTADAERLARFRREAQVLASLNHPNIAAIYGFEQSGGVHALVLELVEGPTLADRIAQGPVLLDEAVPIARQIADALEAAHDQGVIHRDLKPANIKVRPDGTAKVLDFGLAKALEPAAVGDADATGSPTITTPAMTRVGMILGTAAYMSPEQAKGRAADKRSDVWAFGCVLYEMLTGRRAFEGEGVTDTLAAVLRGEPDWNALPSDLSPALRMLVQRCLEKDRGRRIGDLGAARFVLDQSAGPMPVATAAGRSSPRGGSAAAAATAAVLLVAALGGVVAWRLLPTAPAMSVARFSFTMPEDQQPTSLGRQFVAISPDGTQLAYVANRRIFLRSLSDFTARAIPGTEDGLILSMPAFSPDGQAIAFYSGQDRAVKRISAVGGAAIAVCSPGGQPFGLTWHSTGIVFALGREGIFRCSQNGGGPDQLADAGEGEEVYGPQLLSDGTTLLFTVARPSDGGARWDTAQVVTQSIGTGSRTTVLSAGSDARYLPTGHLIYAVRGVVFAVPFDPDRQTVTGEPVPVVEGVLRPLAPTTAATQLATSANGTLLYVPGPAGTISAQRALAVAERAGAPTRLEAPVGQYQHVRASRDGRWLAIGGDDGQEAIVWLFDVGGKSAMRRLTFGGQNRYPIWSPDGQRVAFQSDRDGAPGLYTQNADGAGVAQRLTTADQGEAHIPESWSPDGRYILFSIQKGERHSLHVLSLADNKTETYGGVATAQPIGAVFSPDGRWVAYGWRPDDLEGPSVLLREGGPASASRGVYVQPFPATGARFQVPKQPQSFDFHPVWAPDGAELFYIPTATAGQMAVVSVTTRPALAFGSPLNFPARVTAERLSGEMRAYDIMPDGRFVGLVAPSDSESSPVGIQFRVVLNWFEELKARVPIH
jgi:Tol biopolymer transport system component